MEYTVEHLARLAGVSTRTLRYYDQIGLLKPARNASGYRIYGQDQVDRLWQIMLYREMELTLGAISKVLDDPGFDVKRALTSHLSALTQRRARLDSLIDTVNKTIRCIEEGIPMSDHEKFEGFKRQLIDENERRYGEEARAKYGEDAVEESNRKMMNLTKKAYDDMQEIGTELQARLERAVLDGVSPDGEEGAALCALHKEWLGYTWGKYSPEAHKGLTQMYVDDARFAAHYDANVAGCAQFLRDAVHTHA